MVHVVAIVLGCMLSLFVLAGMLGWFLAWLLYIPVPRKLPGRDDKSKLWSYMWRIKLIKFYSWWRVKFNWKKHRVIMIREYFKKYFTPKTRPLISFGDPDLKVKATSFSGVRVKLYRPKAEDAGLLPGMVYLHGGCWTFGSADYMDGLTTILCKRVNMVVASVNYRLAPEHTYPTPLDDCVNATKHFLQNAANYNVDPLRVAIAGDSAGGNLAAAVTLRLRDEGFKPQLKMQVLIYPCLQAVNFFLPSHEMNDEDPYLDRKFIISCYLWYAVGNNKLLRKVLKKKHLSPEMHEKVSKYVNMDLLPDEPLDTVKPNTEVLRKGKLVMKDENASAAEKEALLNEVFQYNPIADVEIEQEKKDPDLAIEQSTGDKIQEALDETKDPEEKPYDGGKRRTSATLEVPKERFNAPADAPKPGVEIIHEGPVQSPEKDLPKEAAKEETVANPNESDQALLINPDEIEHIFTDPYFSPLLAEDLGNLPDTYLLTCDQDLVRDEAFMYMARLKEAGVKVEHAHYLSLHALLDCVVDVTYARYALDRMAEYIKRNL